MRDTSRQRFFFFAQFCKSSLWHEGWTTYENLRHELSLRKHRQYTYVWTILPNEAVTRSQNATSHFRVWIVYRNGGRCRRSDIPYDERVDCGIADECVSDGRALTLLRQLSETNKLGPVGFVFGACAALPLFRLDRHVVEPRIAGRRAGRWLRWNCATLSLLMVYRLCSIQWSRTFCETTPWNAALLM